MLIELTFLLNRRSIKVTLFLENLFHFTLDISPNCFLFMITDEINRSIPLLYTKAKPMKRDLHFFNK